MQPAIEPATQTDRIKINSYCGVCGKPLVITRGYPNICKVCKANIAFISRNHHYSWGKIKNLQLRLDALIISKLNPTLSIAETLRQATRANKEQI